MPPSRCLPFQSRLSGDHHNDDHDDHNDDHGDDHCHNDDHGDSEDYGDMVMLVMMNDEQWRA